MIPPVHQALRLLVERRVIRKRSFGVYEGEQNGWHMFQIDKDRYAVNLIAGRYEKEPRK